MSYLVKHVVVLAGVQLGCPEYFYKEVFNVVVVLVALVDGILNTFDNKLAPFYF